MHRSDVRNNQIDYIMNHYYIKYNHFITTMMLCQLSLSTYEPNLLRKDGP